MDMRISKGLLLFFFSTLISINVFAEKNYLPDEVIVKYKPGVVRAAAMVQEAYNEVGVLSVDYFKGSMSDFEHLYLDGSMEVLEAIQKLRLNPMIEFAQPNYVLSLPKNVNPKGMPCLIPGFPFPPGCDDGGGDEPPPDNGGGMPCLIPGFPFPPGCEDGGGSEPITKPELQPAPIDVPVAPDPSSGDLWGMQKIEVQQAQQANAGRQTQEIVVAVIDTGIDYNHEDLAANVWRNPNPTNNDIVGYDFFHNDGLPYDDHGHGSHTSGTVGATGSNGVGVYGVASNVKIMGLKFLSKDGQGSTAGAVSAIDYAVEHGAKILSNSWGGPSNPMDPEGDKALEAAVSRSLAKGVLFVAAAGNDGSDNEKNKVYPAAFTHENMITVAASDQQDKLTSFTNYGAKSVHIAAPGFEILSTVTQGKYAKYSGTSMACPHVAGAAAYVWSLNPTWDFKQVKEALLSTADVVATHKGKTVTSARLNLLKASQKQ